MDLQSLDGMVARALRLEWPERDELLQLLQCPDGDVLAMVGRVAALRHAHFGRRVRMNFLLNIKSGLCPEDCHYCSQRRDSSAPIERYPMLPEPDVVRAARMAVGTGARRFCIVASGRGPTPSELEHVARSVEAVKEEMPDLEICACLGLLEEGQAERLRLAGVDAYNHNLNTSEHHYAEICSTHTYDDRVRTVERAAAAGLSPCSGILVGMRESNEDVADMILGLRRLNPDSVPVNFLIPVEGTPLAGHSELTPLHCLRVLAAVRLAFPDAEVRIAGGREVHLRSLQPVALALANSIFVGDYLTTKGQPREQDVAMITDAGYVIEGLESARGQDAVAEIRGTWPERHGMNTAPQDWLTTRLAEVDAEGLRRRPREDTGFAIPPFNTNDYLSLAGDPRIAAAAACAAKAAGAGATGSRLLSGNYKLLEQLESAVATLKGTEAALVAPSGYHANVAVLQALGGPDAHVISDSLNHASIVDGSRLSRARTSVFAHRDLSALERLLRASGSLRPVIVTDSVFSMDGTVADLASLLALARAHSAWLVVDDAHATGVLGPAGAGAWAAAGLAPDPQVVLTGSLSKAFGAQGGFIAGTSSLRDLVLNLGRAIIFSTALSPALAGAALEAIRVSGDEPWRRENAVARARQLRDALGVESPLQHPIVPFVLGDPGRAVDVARRLREGGFAVSAVRPPSVPHGTSRLRLTTTAAHTREHIEALAGAVRAAAGATQPLPVV